ETEDDSCYDELGSLIGQTINLGQIVKTRHPFLNKKAKWRLNDIFDLGKIEPPIYLTSLG
ncbi:13380_t:CDS:1, partial [Entrophospora sp. SA101]